MLALRELQTAFRRAILESDAEAHRALEAVIAPGGMSAGARVGVYRNNVFASLTEALRVTFPVIVRLVGERFFDYAAREFIAAHPPDRPQLSRYGGAFPDFLSGFSPCRDLVYLADVARLEWAMSEAAIAADALFADPSALAGAGDDAPHLVIRLQPSYRYVASPWPIDRIWRENQPDRDGSGIDLGAGGANIEVTRKGDEVVFRRLGAGEFAFRSALARGAALGAALESALAADADFNTAGAVLCALFAEGAVSAVIKPTAKREDDPCDASKP